MPAKVVAFINFKGGVGKTSNVVNLGACLAKYHGRRTLIIDLDAQCNATFWLLRRSQWERLQGNHVRSTAQIFFDHSNGTHLFSFNDAVIQGLPWSDAGISHIPGLDLLPAAIELIDAEERLHQRSIRQFFRPLHDELALLRHAYDYILLDCPPNVYGVAKNGLFFADYYLVPYIPDYLSLSGLRALTELMQRFQHQVGGLRGGGLTSRVAGVIVNRYKQRGNVFDDSINELRLTLGDLLADQLIHPKARILGPPVRDCVRLAECTNYHLPVIIHDERSISARDYGALTEAFIEHFETTLA